MFQLDILNSGLAWRRGQGGHMKTGGERRNFLNIKLENPFSNHGRPL
jgi:hypothetical protein